MIAWRFGPDRVAVRLLGGFKWAPSELCGQTSSVCLWRGIRYNLAIALRRDS